MVSASAGALLVPHAPGGQFRLTLVLGCWAMFGLSLIASLVVLTLIWQRLATQRVGGGHRSGAVDRGRAVRPVDHRGEPAG